MKKSQKATKLENNYCIKIDMIFYLYEHKFQDRDRTITDIQNICKEYETLLCSMFHFRMLSENDFTALYDEATQGEYSYTNLISKAYEMEV